MKPQQERDWLVLAYIYDNDHGTSGGAGLSGLWELVSEEEAATTATGLRERGLIRNEESLSGGYHVTASGRAEVEATRSRQLDRSRRREACREALLRWVDSNTTDIGTRIGRDQFDGSIDCQPFTDEESAAAATYLKEHGLISTIDTAQSDHVLLWITERGRECVDAGVSVTEFVSPPTRREVGVSNVFHMGGTGNTFATAAAAGAVANASVTNFNVDHARLFSAAVRAAADDLELTDEARSAIAEIERENVDLPRAHVATKVLYSFVLGATTGTTGQVLGMLGANALGIGT